MRKTLLFGVALAAGISGFVAWWRGHRRFGSETVNRIVNPWLVRQGVPAASRGEICLLEHVGRTSGTLRVTPVHPVKTREGFRFVVPLGQASQWARNVIAAGRCRVEIAGMVHELDEPRLVAPTEVVGLPVAAARVMDWLGFRYLLLRQFDESPGTLEGKLPERELVAERKEQHLEPMEPVLTA